MNNTRTYNNTTHILASTEIDQMNQTGEMGTNPEIIDIQNSQTSKLPMIFSDRSTFYDEIATKD